MALLLMVVGGCTGGGLGMPSVAASKSIAKARTVGVISAVGHKFALQKMGITVFGNELKEVSIDSWGIDAAVARKVRALLSKRFTVRPISTPQGAFAAYENPAAFSDSSARLQGIVRKLAGSRKYDLIVVVTRAGAPFGSSNQVVTGLGLIEAGGVLNPDNVHLYAVTTAHLYDGRTFERLHWLRIANEYGGSLGTVINAPHRKVDRSWWPATPQAVHNQKLKTATRTLMNEGLARTIPQLIGIKTKTGPQGKKGAWSPFKS